MDTHNIPYKDGNGYPIQDSVSDSYAKWYLLAGRVPLADAHGPRDSKPHSHANSFRNSFSDYVAYGHWHTNPLSNRNKDTEWNSFADPLSNTDPL